MSIVVKFSTEHALYGSALWRIAISAFNTDLKGTVPAVQWSFASDSYAIVLHFWLNHWRCLRAKSATAGKLFQSAQLSEPQARGENNAHYIDAFSDNAALSMIHIKDALNTVSQWRLQQHSHVAVRANNTPEEDLSQCTRC